MDSQRILVVCTPETRAAVEATVTQHAAGAESELHFTESPVDAIARARNSGFMYECVILDAAHPEAYEAAEFVRDLDGQAAIIFVTAGDARAVEAKAKQFQAAVVPLPVIEGEV